jgi:hypothetical protein
MQLEILYYIKDFKITVHRHHVMLCNANETFKEKSSKLNVQNLNLPGSNSVPVANSDLQFGLRGWGTFSGRRGRSVKAVFRERSRSREFRGRIRKRLADRGRLVRRSRSYVFGVLGLGRD